MRGARLTLATLAAVISVTAVAQDEDEDEDELPDLDFLEYLGSWEDGDEDWVVVAEQFMGQPAPAEDEAPVALASETDAADAEDNEADENDEE